MRLSLHTVKKWLAQNAGEQSIDELNELIDLCYAAIKTAESQEARRQEALAAAQQAAVAAGYSSLDELLQAARPTGRRGSSVTTRPLASGVRKPYIDYRHPDAVHAVKKANPPGWFLELEQQGWTLEECRYDRLAAACKARGIKLNFDPVERHAELIAVEPARFKRQAR